MKTKILLSISILSILIFSCSKDDTTTSSTAPKEETKAVNCDSVDIISSATVACPMPDGYADTTVSGADSVDENGIPFYTDSCCIANKASSLASAYPEGSTFFSSSCNNLQVRYSMSFGPVQQQMTEVFQQQGDSVLHLTEALSSTVALAGELVDPICKESALP